jgi:hypothetical protein
MKQSRLRLTQCKYVERIALIDITGDAKQATRWHRAAVAD